MKFLLHPPIENARLQPILATAASMSVINAADEREALAHMPEADAFFGKITPPLLAAAPRLRWVQSPTASLEHYLFPELIAHPCVLTNMRGLFSDVIADQVFGYILCFARNLHRYIRQQMHGQWAPIGGEQARASFTIGPGLVSDIDRAHLHLSDATLGIVGLGAIGEEVARRGSAFGMRVLAVDPVRAAAVGAASRAAPEVGAASRAAIEVRLGKPDLPPIALDALWPVERLPDLLAQSDFVVIAAPHTPETVKMFRRTQFQQMKRSAYLINIGRGAIVDLRDLTDALREGEIQGAGLDVFETEPLPSDHPLWSMGNKVIITPHVAGFSPRIAERHLGVLLENIRRFVRGEPLMNVVDKTRWF